ncbi:MAG: AAA family ATPase [Deltaproteobacteria bacterium]|nr:AAA family ATPase [Deltaproteobacteria bacterium]MBM4323839.1 AAA family ATPase [Deltaproteobacteria bacterium]MBM4346949.1 AAA family ATPase [Deltaproteobacteria bacterium]
MYTKFYQFKIKPFEITPDPKFLFLSESHKEALAHLTYAVREKKGFTVITGEVGTGKTTLVQTLLSRLNGNTKTAYIFNPILGSTDFIHSICEDLGMKTLKKSKGQYIHQLQQYLLDCYSRNDNVVLIIDEAHTLDPKLLEEVRLLTNLETPKAKLLQVILLGQPELNGILDSPELRQLKQRVSLRYHLKPLSQSDTLQFIKKRIRMAGAPDSDIFTPKAINEIYRYSKGIPRLINIVCDNALLIGYANDQKMIGPKVIRDVIDQLEGIGTKKRKRRLVIPAVVVLFLLICGGLSFALWKETFPNVKAEMIEKTRTITRTVEKIYHEAVRKFFN